MSAQINARSADCIVRWHNLPLLGMVVHSIVPRVRNICLRVKIS
jgi:hypothetical protein